MLFIVLKFALFDSGNKAEIRVKVGVRIEFTVTIRVKLQVVVTFKGRVLVKI